MREAPLVSICVPSYNSARYLKETLDSIVAQTYRNIEVVIADNASTDDSVAIANEYARRYGFKVIVNEKNVGPFGNWNVLVSQARGEFVAIYHSDDIYRPEIVEQSVAALMREPKVGLLGTLATVIDENSKEFSTIQLPPGVPELPRYSFSEMFRAVLKDGGGRIFLVTPSVMVRRSCYEELGLFDTSGHFSSAGDYEMWFRIALHHSVAVIPRQLMRYRVHLNQGSERELRRNIALPDVINVLDKYVEAGGDDPALRTEYQRYRNRACFKTALKQNCRGEFRRSLDTCGLIDGTSYRVSAVALGGANRLHLNLRCWPGRPWPCRVVLEQN
jgi:glycosyltransferase involved in cell wall biosynthesis